MSMASSMRRSGAQPPIRPQSRSLRLRQFKQFLRSRNSKGYLFVLPWLFGFLFFYISPFINTVYLSFTQYNLFSDPVWVGLKNYQEIFLHDATFQVTLRNMLFYVTISTMVTVGGGLFFAVLLARNFPGNHFFRTILYVPSLLVGVAIGTLFREVFRGGDTGLANIFLSLFHVGPINWLHSGSQPLLAILAVTLVDFWFIGGTMLIFIAGIKGINPIYYEAAKLDGANAWTLFRQVTMPLLAPVIVFNVITNLIWHIQAFEIPLSFVQSDASALATGDTLGDNARLATFLTDMYTKAFIYGKYGYGAAIACIVFVVTLLLTSAVLWISARYSYQEN